MTPWSNAYLDQMREVTDPLADQVVATVLKEKGFAGVTQIMASLTRNDQIVPDDLPEIAQTYFKETAALPDYYDPELAAAGQEMFGTYGIAIVNALFCYSLPLTYTAWRGAHVLFYTQRMTKHVHRRLFETAQFIFDVTDPESFTGQGHAIRSAQKVRLMHASIRQYLKHGQAWGVEWDTAEWGEPLNQEDLAGTLMAFSVIVLRALEIYGLDVTEKEKEGYFHLWRVVGHIMGVHPKLIPQTAAEGDILVDMILARQQGPSEAGQVLAEALIEFMQSVIPGHLFDGLAASSIRQCLGDEVADMIAIPKANWTRYIVTLQERLMDLEEWIGHDIPTLDRVAQFAQRKFLESIVLIDRGGNRPEFRIPPGLQENWKLTRLTNPDLPPAAPNAYENEPWAKQETKPMTTTVPEPIHHPSNIPWIMFQGWDNLLFMHWPVDPDFIRPMVPEPMELDLYDGKAWITMIPFKMADVHLRDLPAVPFMGNFPEINLRIYVRVNDLPGVYFFSIDAGNRMDAWVASKFFHIPYVYSKCTFSDNNGEYRVTGNRTAHSGFKAAELDVTYRPKGDPFAPAEGSLAHFLVERYLLFSIGPDGQVYRGDTQHAPWTLYEAEAEIQTNTILSAAGIDLPNIDEPQLHYSVGTQSHMWPVLPMKDL